MLIFNSLTNITVNSETFSFYYSYGKDSTFQGLFEHFALLCPSLNICPCYHFKFFFNGQNGNISKAYKILQFKNVLNNLTLFKIEDICPHNNSNYLLLSKLDLFNEYQKMKKQFQIENGNKNMIINDLNKEKERLIQVIKSTKKKLK